MVPTSKKPICVSIRAHILKGGDSGPAVAPSHPERSLLIKAIGYGDKELQRLPEAELADRQNADLSSGVQMGAPFPPNLAMSKDGSGRDHWAFQAPRAPAAPAIKNPGWPPSSLDHFVLAKLEAKGLKPAPTAARPTLIRRATFDLFGLPPTPAAVEAFRADTSVDAFAKVVDRLLASPHFGERWARHWLGVARYADSNGLDENGAVGNALGRRRFPAALVSLVAIVTKASAVIYRTRAGTGHSGASRER